MKDSYVFYKDRLGGEYKTAFDQIEMYVTSQNVEDDTLEERMGELLDIFLISQEEGKPVREITGNQMERFCETFCSDFGVKNRLLYVAEYMKSLAKVLLFVSVLELFFSILDILENGGMSVKSAVSAAGSFNISGYLIGIFAAGLLAMAVNVVIRRMMFKSKKISMRLLRALSCAGACVGFLVIFFAMSVSETELFHCPSWVMTALCGGYLLAYHLLWGRHNRRRKIRFLELVQEESRKGMPEEMEKKFQKAREKSLKKGKGELTLEQFLDKEEIECGKVERLKYFYILMPVLIVAAGFVFTLLGEGFESMADMVIYLAVMVCVETPLMYGLWRITRLGVRERREWIKEKREKSREN